MSDDIGKAALEYVVQRGWKVLPLHSIDSTGECSCGTIACQSPGKHPRNISGSRGASNDPAQIDYWWTQWPNANVGIATGRDNGLAILDIDGETGIKSLETLELPQTLEVTTGSGGKHLYYQYPKESEIRNSAKKVAPGIDVRGEGGYVVAPPSTHASGGRYSFSNTRSMLAAYPVLPGRQEASGEPVDVPDMIPSGQRNDTLTSLAGAMRRKGMNEEEIFVALQAVNQRCVPRMGDNELRGISKSVSRYHPEEAAHIAAVHREPLRVWTAKELCAEPDDELDYLLGPILVRGNRLVIAGHTGEGKTTFALQLVGSYLNGDKFLKWVPRRDSTVRDAGEDRSVLLLDAEQGLRTIKRRFRETDLSDSERLLLVRVPDGINLDHHAESEIIEEVIDAHKPDVVVLDPLYKLHKGEVTDERVAVDLMRRLDAWRERYHFALVLLAHCRKPPPGAPFTIHDVFGSTAVSRGAEVVLGLQRTGSGTSRLYFFKDRDGDLPVGEEWELIFDRGSGFQSPLQLLWQDEGDNTESQGNSTGNSPTVGGGSVINLDSFRP